jgi:hypothetical protein
MSELIATAERLRTVKNAFREFMQLWAIDALMAQHRSIDWIVGDILRASESTDAVKKSQTHNLSFLYTGRGLDD